MAFIIARQDGDEESIVPLTKENLCAIVEEQDPKINKLIEKGRLTKVIKIFNAK